MRLRGRVSRPRNAAARERASVIERKFITSVNFYIELESFDLRLSRTALVPHDSSAIAIIELKLYELSLVEFS